MNNLFFSPASLRLTNLTALQIFHSKRFTLSLALFEFPVRKVSLHFPFSQQHIVKLTSPSFCPLKVSRLFLPFEHSVHIALYMCVCMCMGVFLYVMLFQEAKSWLPNIWSLVTIQSRDTMLPTSLVPTACFLLHHHIFYSIHQAKNYPIHLIVYPYPDSPT